jgi:hypothetical protein
MKRILASVEKGQVGERSQDARGAAAHGALEAEDRDILLGARRSERAAASPRAGWKSAQEKTAPEYTNALYEQQSPAAGVPLVAKD